MDITNTVLTRYHLKTNCGGHSNTTTRISSQQNITGSDTCDSDTIETNKPELGVRS